jgi:hypothetical protein
MYEIQNQLGRFWYCRIGCVRHTLRGASTYFEQFASFWDQYYRKPRL